MKGSDSDLTVLFRRLPLGSEENHEDKLLLFHLHLTVSFFLNRKYNLPRHVTVTILHSHFS
jgi:hypothetical protein